MNAAPLWTSQAMAQAMHLDRTQLSGLETRAIDDRAAGLKLKIAEAALAAGTSAFRRQDWKGVSEMLGRYVELDLIVPEYVKKTDTWEKLPWFAAFQADTGPRDKPTLYRLGDRSFVLIFAASPASPASLVPAPAPR